MGLFITFEGGDGSGKTSIIETLAKELTERGYEILKTREPGGSKIAEEIRAVILNVENVMMDNKTEALLYAAGRRQHLIEVLKPALAAGKTVLCDRYVDSSLAYQGYARGLGIDVVYQLNAYAIEGMLPDLTFYIDIDPAVGLGRIKTAHRSADRLELEDPAFHNKVRFGYQKVAAMFPERIRVVDGAQPLEAICAEIKALILRRL